MGGGWRDVTRFAAPIGLTKIEVAGRQQSAGRGGDHSFGFRRLPSCTATDRRAACLVGQFSKMEMRGRCFAAAIKVERCSWEVGKETSVSLNNDLAAIEIVHRNCADSRNSGLAFSGSSLNADNQTYTLNPWNYVHMGCACFKLPFTWVRLQVNR